MLYNVFMIFSLLSIVAFFFGVYKVVRGPKRKQWGFTTIGIFVCIVALIFILPLVQTPEDVASQKARLDKVNAERELFNEKKEKDAEKEKAKSTVSANLDFYSTMMDDIQDQKGRTKVEIKVTNKSDWEIVDGTVDIVARDNADTKLMTDVLFVKNLKPGRSANFTIWVPKASSMKSYTHTTNIKEIAK